jgi:hypothetical protein
MAAGGSSGAVAGVMGAYAAIYPTHRLRLPATNLSSSAVTIILLWLGWEAAQAIVTLQRGVALGVGHWAHVGGLVFGMTIGPLMSGGGGESTPSQALPRDAGAGGPAPGDPRSAGTRSAPAGRDPAPGTRDPVSDHHSHLRWVPGGVPRQPAPLAGTDEELPQSEECSFQSARQGAAAAVERLTRAGEQEYAVALYRQAIEEGRPLPLPGPVEFRIATWLTEGRNWALACDAFLSVAHSDAEADLAATALYRAIQIAEEQLRRPQLAERLRRDLLFRFPGSRWSALAAHPSGETPEPPSNDPGRGGRS